LERRGAGGGFVACLPAAEDSRLGVAPPAGRDRRTAFPRAAAEAAPLVLVAAVGEKGADAAAPPARGVAAVEPLDLAAPVLAGAPLVRTVAAAGLPDFAAPVVGAPPPVRTPAAAGRRSDLAGAPLGTGATNTALGAAVSYCRATRPALEAVVSSSGVAPVDREDEMATASES